MKKKFSWNCCSRRRWIISSFVVLVAVCGSITIFHNYVHNISFVYSYVVLLHLRFVSVEFHTVEISYGEISYCKDLLRRSSIKAVTRIYLVIRRHQKQPPEVFCVLFFLQACNFIKKKLQHRCFPVKIAKVFKNSCFEEHLQTTTSNLCGFCYNMSQILSGGKNESTAEF